MSANSGNDQYDLYSPHAVALRKAVRYRALVRSLYFEIVVDGRRGTDRAGVENFIKVLDWRRQKSITEQEFTALYREWVGQPVEGPNTCIVSEDDLAEILADRNESDLDVLLSVLINEYNGRLMSQGNVTRDWVQRVEHLFFMLDGPGHGHIGLDEISFLMLSMVGGSAASLDVDELERYTRAFMEQLGSAIEHSGVVTLKWLKKYFISTAMNEAALDATIARLVGQLAKYRAVVGSRLSNIGLGVPRLWERAVFAAVAELTDTVHLFDAKDDVTTYLLLYAPQKRYSFGTAPEQTWKLAVAVFEDFCVRHKYVLSDLTESAILQDTRFLFIQRALALYRELVRELLSALASDVPTPTSPIADGGAILEDPLVSRPTGTDGTVPPENLPTDEIASVRDLERGDLETLLRNARWIDLPRDILAVQGNPVTLPRLGPSSPVITPSYQQTDAMHPQGSPIPVSFNGQAYNDFMNGSPPLPLAGRVSVHPERLIPDVSTQRVQRQGTAFEHLTSSDIYAGYTQGSAPSPLREQHSNRPVSIGKPSRSSPGFPSHHVGLGNTSQDNVLSQSEYRNSPNVGSSRHSGPLPIRAHVSLASFTSGHPEEDDYVTEPVAQPARLASVPHKKPGRTGRAVRRTRSANPSRGKPAASNRQKPRTRTVKSKATSGRGRATKATGPTVRYGTKKHVPPTSNRGVPTLQLTL